MVLGIDSFNAKSQLGHHKIVSDKRLLKQQGLRGEWYSEEKRLKNR